MSGIDDRNGSPLSPAERAVLDALEVELVASDRPSVGETDARIGAALSPVERAVLDAFEAEDRRCAVDVMSFTAPVAVVSGLVGLLRNPFLHAVGFSVLLVALLCTAATGIEIICLNVRRDERGPAWKARPSRGPSKSGR